MQVPLGLICGSCVRTAIFVRCPDSLATATISTTPCKTSGASNSNNPFTKPGWVLDKVICGPFCPLRTETTKHLILEPCS